MRFALFVAHKNLKCMRFKFRLLAILLFTMSIISSCDEAQVVERSNPLLEQWDTPFGIAPFERIKPRHYLEAFDVAVAEQQAEIEQITSPTTPVEFGTVIVALDHSGGRLKDLGDLFEMCEMAISDADWVSVGDVIKPKISQAEDSIWMNEELFARVKTLYDGRKKLGLNGVDARLLERTYRRFVRGGAELDAEKKSRLVEINSRLARLSSRFAANLIGDSDGFILTLRSQDMEGLTPEHKRVAREEAERRGIKDRWVVTLNPASMLPFLTYASRRDLREKLYSAYLKRGANGNEFDNRAIVVEMTALRQERAKMLGYKTHAEYVISQQMAGSAAAARKMLEEAWQPALKIATKERDALQELLARDITGAKLERWDWWYYAEKYRATEADITNEMLRPYFPLDGVRVGMFTLANRLYGITFRPVAVPLYEQSCTAYEVLDRDGSHLGVLYLDLFARSNKSHGAWCGNLREQRTDGGERITPVVAITCNFPEQTGNNTTLLTLEQVETLFHEFGHSLHFIFQNVDYRSMGSERVEGDFVEFPSQLMENWATEPEMLRLYALHYRTGRPITELEMKKMAAMRTLGQGFETITYLSAALLDIELQSVTNFEKFDLEKFERKVLREKRGLIEEIEPKYHLSYFAHPFVYDYSAGYYFYMWSEVLDKDCFEQFRKGRDLFSRELADKLRKEILSRGSERSGRDMYRAFAGGDPDPIYMLRSKGLVEKLSEEESAVAEMEAEIGLMESLMDEAMEATGAAGAAGAAGATESDKGAEVAKGAEAAKGAKGAEAAEVAKGAEAKESGERRGLRKDRKIGKNDEK